MANFKGFKQVSLATYNGLSDEAKKQYLWLVRDMQDETVLSSAIYFGTRKYAEVNDNSASAEMFENLLTSLGDLVDENGEFVGFLPVEEHELLSSAATFSEAFSILEAAILSNADELAGKVGRDEFEQTAGDVDTLKGKVESLEETVGELDTILSSITETVTENIEQELEDVKGDLNDEKAKVSALEEKATNLEDAVSELEQAKAETETALSALTQELETKADANDVYTKDETYTKDEIDAKVAGAFHFVGNADAINDEMTELTVDGDTVEASEDNVGDVYQIGDAEYASNGSVWVKLGFNMDMSQFATKDFVNSAVTEEAAAREQLESRVNDTQEALNREIEEREALQDTVDTIANNATTTASTFSDAEELDLQLGQIVYVTNEETVSGVTYSSGAYINTQDGLKKLDSTTPSTSVTLEQRVETLENRTGSIETKLGNEEIEGESVTAAIAALQADHEITGDDVEE